MSVDSTPIVYRDGIPTAGAPGPVVVYQPGGTTSANVYADLTRFQTACQAVKGPKTLFFDTTFVAGIGDGTVHITTGTWNFGPTTTWTSNGNGITLDDGAESAIPPWDVLDNAVIFMAGSTPFYSQNILNTGFAFRMINNAYLVSNTGTAPALQNLDTGSGILVAMYGFSFLDGENGAACLDGGAGSLTVSVFDSASVGANALSCSGTIGFELNTISSGGVSGTQIGSPIIGVIPNYNGGIFAQTSPSTVTNTTSTSSLVGTGRGSMTLWESILQEGTTFDLELSGEFDADASAPGDVVIAITLNGTTIAQTNTVPWPIGVPSSSTRTWRIRSKFTVGVGSGTVLCQSAFEGWVSTGVVGFAIPGGTSPVSVSPGLLDVTITFNVASTNNLITTTACTLSCFNPALVP